MMARWLSMVMALLLCSAVLGTVGTALNAPLPVASRAVCSSLDGPFCKSINGLMPPSPLPRALSKPGADTAPVEKDIPKGLLESVFEMILKALPSDSRQSGKHVSDSATRKKGGRSRKGRRRVSQSSGLRSDAEEEAEAEREATREARGSELKRGGVPSRRNRKKATNSAAIGAGKGKSSSRDGTSRPADSNDSGGDSGNTGVPSKNHHDTGRKSKGRFARRLEHASDSVRSLAASNKPQSDPQQTGGSRESSESSGLGGSASNWPASRTPRQTGGAKARSPSGDPRPPHGSADLHPDGPIGSDNGDGTFTSHTGKKFGYRKQGNYQGRKVANVDRKHSPLERLEDDGDEWEEDLGEEDDDRYGRRYRHGRGYVDDEEDEDEDEDEGDGEGDGEGAEDEGMEDEDDTALDPSVFRSLLDQLRVAGVNVQVAEMDADQEDDATEESLWRQAAALFSSGEQDGDEDALQDADLGAVLGEAEEMEIGGHTVKVFRIEFDSLESLMNAADAEAALEGGSDDQPDLDDWDPDESEDEP